MPFSFRVKLETVYTEIFKLFLESEGLADIKIGSYKDGGRFEKICILRTDDNSEDILATILKYGSLENGFEIYMTDKTKWRRG